MENTQTTTIKQIMKGVGISLLATLLFLTIFAIILTYTNVSESTISPVIIIATGISILIGSIIANRKITKNGIINGGLVGIIYILIIYLISSLLNGRFSLNIQSIIMMIVAFFCGIIGGIIGINRK